ncbi:hypothetical protein PGTUg99_010238 [Puccinia graminis f. sp. tritici]|uniref:Uncharacterized protein n=1 Tax=Puccinia graminis f. sp. tritici TaxID=56615 RepID=A0A5B0M5I2_PUCGR|nr:hypothetical protein PGTUg99_010238 [Puccinia graminis f. sp. tritici]
MSGQIRIRAQDQHLLFCIAAGSISGNVTLWEWSAENQGHDAIEPVQTTLVGHKGAIYDLAYSPRGEMLSTASEDRSVRVWDLTNLGASPIVLWGHFGRVWRVHWWNSEQLTSVGEVSFSFSQVVFLVLRHHTKTRFSPSLLCCATGIGLPSIDMEIFHIL